MLRRNVDSNSEWLLGLIVASWDQQRGWATEVQTDLKWLARLETGVSPSGTTLLAQAKATTNKNMENKHAGSQQLWGTTDKTPKECKDQNEVIRHICGMLVTPL